jgi:hypothetical protein
MDKEQVIDRICELLDDDEVASVNTSMRLPGGLRDAAALAVEHLGIAPTATMLTATALRAALESAVMTAALDEHVRLHPTVRPSRAEVALALAEQDGSPWAAHPDIVALAAEQVTRHRPDASGDDVLLWVQAQHAARTAA